MIYAQASIEMKRKAAKKLKEHESSVFKGDAAFKYDDDETIKKLSGLKNADILRGNLLAIAK